MPRPEEATRLAMELDDQERLRVAEELVVSMKPEAEMLLRFPYSVLRAERSR